MTSVAVFLWEWVKVLNERTYHVLRILLMRVRNFRVLKHTHTHTRTVCFYVSVFMLSDS